MERPRSMYAEIQSATKEFSGTPRDNPLQYLSKTAVDKLSQGTLKVADHFRPYKTFVGAFVPNSLMEYHGISDTAKLIWARLAQHEGDKGVAMPGIDTLAHELGDRPVATIQDAIRELEVQGFIVVLPAIDVVPRVNMYIFLWHPVFEQTIPTVMKRTMTDEHKELLRRRRAEKLAKKRPAGHDIYDTFESVICATFESVINVMLDLSFHDTRFFQQMIPPRIME